MTGRPISPVVEVVADLLLFVIGSLCLYFALATGNIFLGIGAGWAYRSIFA